MQSLSSNPFNTAGSPTSSYFLGMKKPDVWMHQHQRVPFHPQQYNFPSIPPTGHSHHHPGFQANPSFQNLLAVHLHALAAAESQAQRSHPAFLNSQHFLSMLHPQQAMHMGQRLVEESKLIAAHHNDLRESLQQRTPSPANDSSTSSSVPRTANNCDKFSIEGIMKRKSSIEASIA